MPVSPAVIEGLFATANNVWNWFNQERLNKQKKQDQIEAEQRQQRYDLEAWNRTNAYNHPMQQMNRLRQAGLNPNLIYGRGADNTAAAISNVRAQNTDLDTSVSQNPVSAQSIIAGLQQSNNDALAKASIDQTAANIALQKKEELVKDGQIAKMAAETANTTFQTEQAKKLQDYVVKRAELENTNLEQMMKIGWDRNEREKIMSSDNHEIAIQQVINMKQQKLLDMAKVAQSQAEVARIYQDIENMEVIKQNLLQDFKMKEFEAKMRDKGIVPGSPWWWSQLNNDINPNGPSTLENIGTGISNSAQAWNNMLNNAVGWTYKNGSWGFDWARTNPNAKKPVKIKVQTTKPSTSYMRTF